MKIEKKSWPEMFQVVMDGKKNFDVRICDFDCSEGDVLVLREWDPEKKEYTGRVLEKEIKVVVKTKDLKFFSDEDIEKYGFQVLGF